MVDDSKYGIMALNRGQTSDKVHADLSKGECLGFSSDTVKWGLSRMGHGFVLLADRAPLDVVCYPLFHPQPLGALMGLSESFIPSRVSGGRMVVVDSH